MLEPEVLQPDTPVPFPTTRTAAAAAAAVELTGSCCLVKVAAGRVQMFRILSPRYHTQPHLRNHLRSRRDPRTYSPAEFRTIEHQQHCRHCCKILHPDKRYYRFRTRVGLQRDCCTRFPDHRNWAMGTLAAAVVGSDMTAAAGCTFAAVELQPGNFAADCCKSLVVGMAVPLLRNFGTAGRTLAVGVVHMPVAVVADDRRDESSPVP